MAIHKKRALPNHGSHSLKKRIAVFRGFHAEYIFMPMNDYKEIGPKLTMEPTELERIKEASSRYFPAPEHQLIVKLLACYNDREDRLEGCTKQIEKLEKKLAQLSQKQASKKTERLSKVTPLCKGQKAKGHAHRAAELFTEAKTIEVEHPQLKKGDLCSDCKQGRLYLMAPGEFLRMLSQPFLQYERYRLQRLRCSLCGKTFTAHLPKSATDRIDKTLKASITLFKYRAGLPFYRQNQLQKLFGQALSPSQLFQATEDVASALSPLFKALCHEAAQANCLHNDDTTVQILDQNKKRRTSAILAKFSDKQIALFFSGEKTAGKNLDILLDLRQNPRPPIQMSDASSQSQLKRNASFSAYCLVHARRKFYELLPLWPKEALAICQRFNAIFHFDDQAKLAKLTAEERLIWHQQKSTKKLNVIKKHCNFLLNRKRVEPNSSFGKAIAYLNKHWQKLTLFLHMPEVPLCNNENEQLIKRAVLNRNNAHFFKNAKGANYGDILMSCIETCVLNKINPWQYLVDVQEYSQDVKREPHLWFPWNYQERLQTLQQKLQLAS
jgi:transposase